MKDVCETVRVVAPVSDANPHGFVVINRSDLKPDHEVFDDKPKPTKLTLPVAKVSAKA